MLLTFILSICFFALALQAAGLEQAVYLAAAALLASSWEAGGRQTAVTVLHRPGLPLFIRPGCPGESAASPTGGERGSPCGGADSSGPVG